MSMSNSCHLRLLSSYRSGMEPWNLVQNRLRIIGRKGDLKQTSLWTGCGSTTIRGTAGIPSQKRVAGAQLRSRYINTICLSEKPVRIMLQSFPESACFFARPSPLLITKDAVSAMKPGSASRQQLGFWGRRSTACLSEVIVDLAAIGGGNCELTRLNETIVTENNVTIIGSLA